MGASNVVWSERSSRRARPPQRTLHLASLLSSRAAAAAAAVLEVLTINKQQKKSATQKREPRFFFQQLLFRCHIIRQKVDCYEGVERKTVRTTPSNSRCRRHRRRHRLAIIDDDTNPRRRPFQISRVRASGQEGCGHTPRHRAPRGAHPRVGEATVR